MTPRHLIAIAPALVGVASTFCGLFHPETASAQGLVFEAISFNVGTTTVLPHDDDLTDGYTSVEADLSERHYGNGLAWQPAIAAAAAFVAQQNPEIIAFQELFDVEECATIPQSAWPGFVCEIWSPGSPSVVERITGPGYQIACHVGRPDKCVAVRSDFGSFEGCASSLCLDGLDGAIVPGCGGGSRVGRGRVQLVNGGVLTIAHMHGTSGIKSDDMECRELQFDQIFDDLDGRPAADGAYNLVLGDFNTDPVRLIVFDSSAQRLASYVGEALPFGYLSSSGSQDPPSYFDFLTFDHVASDSISGDCSVPGLTPGIPPVFATPYFDHKPVVCVPEISSSIGTALGFLALAATRRARHAKRSERFSSEETSQKRYVTPSPSAP